MVGNRFIAALIRPKTFGPLRTKDSHDAVFMVLESLIAVSPHASNPHRGQKHFLIPPGLIRNTDTWRDLLGRTDIPLVADSNEV